MIAVSHCVKFQGWNIGKLKPEEANIMETQYEDCTPNWEATAQMLALILESGDDKTWARSEIIRMGQIIDRLQAKEVQA